MAAKKESIIPDIPADKLVSQPINVTHRQEFVIEFTRIIFKPRIVAAVPKDIKDPKLDINLQLSLLMDAFPLMQKEGFREVYGDTKPRHKLVRFPHRVIKDITDSLTYNAGHGFFGDHAVNQNCWGNLNAMSREMRFAIEKNLPNTAASVDLLAEMETKYSETEGAWGKDDLNLWLPREVCGLSSLITEKKSQGADGVVSRQPVIKKQFAMIIPKGVQAKILKWEKTRRKDPGATKLEEEIINMRKFAAELYEAVRIVRNTKQFQQRFPDMFDEFCGITGLGQCDGKALISTESMDLVNSVLGDWKKSRQ